MSKIQQCKSAREIGSYFDINPSDITNFVEEEEFTPFGKALYLSTCRSAIDMVLSGCTSKKKVALLPGFTCHAVVGPFIKNGYKVYPYSITKELEIDRNDLVEKVDKYRPDVILVHDYFGFDSNKNLRKSDLMNRFLDDGITIINDQTQSMFSEYPRLKGNYYLGSIRKWMGVPDGAFLMGMDASNFLVPDEELETAKIAAMVYKHNYLFNDVGTKDKLLANYRTAEAILDSREQPFSISNIAKELINHYDFLNIKNARQMNAQILLKKLSKCDKLFCPFEYVSDDEVPFHIPILVKNKRKEFQTYLAQNSVFATVIWACPEEFQEQISSETRSIYDEILCVPCDQRYNKEDMKYICALIDKFDWDN